jgi:hypothetical protein
MHSGPMRFVFENREEDKSDLKIRGGRRHCHVYHRPFGRAIALAARLLKQRQTYILVGGSFLPQCIINGTLSTTPAICTIGEQLPLSMHLICREIDTRAWTIDETRSRRAFRACSANPTIYTGFRNQGLFSHSPCSPSISALPPLKPTRRTCRLISTPRFRLFTLLKHHLQQAISGSKRLRYTALSDHALLSQRGRFGLCRSRAAVPRDPKLPNFPFVLSAPKDLL